MTTIIALSPISGQIFTYALSFTPINLAYCIIKKVFFKEVPPVGCPILNKGPPPDWMVWYVVS